MISKIWRDLRSILHNTLIQRCDIELMKREREEVPEDKIPTQATDADSGNVEKKKRRRRKKKAAPPAPSSDPAIHLESLNEYLTSWSTQRDGWKFNKNLQTWVIERCLTSAVPAVSFRLFLEYSASIAGRARDRLVELCRVSLDSSAAPTDLNKYQKRAKKILRVLNVS